MSEPLEGYEVTAGAGYETDVSDGSVVAAVASAILDMHSRRALRRLSPNQNVEMVCFCLDWEEVEALAGLPPDQGDDRTPLGVLGATARATLESKRLSHGKN